MKDHKGLLREQKLFSNTPEDILEQLAAVSKEVFYEKGAVVMQESDPSDFILFITQGLVFVYTTNEEGAVFPIVVLHEGQSVGEMGAVSGADRSATVEALTDVKGLIIESNTFKDIISLAPSLSEQLLLSLTRRLQRDTDSLQREKSLDLQDKAMFLLELLTPHFQGGVVSLSQEKLAEVIGVTRPRLTEALQKLQKSGRIQLSRRSIQVI